MSDRMTPEEYRRAAQRASGQQPETAILRAVRDYLQLPPRPWFVVRMQQGLGSYKGLADLYCLRDGRSVWIEIKTPQGRLSRHQRAFKDAIEAHGGEYVVARSVEDVMEL